MTGDSHTSSSKADRRWRRLGDFVRGVLSAFVAPAMVVSLPVLRLVARQRKRSDPRLAAGTPAAPCGSSHVVHARTGVTAKREPLFLIVRVEPGFSPPSYAETFAALQLVASPMLLDLVPARTLCADVFEHLAGAWIASPDTVPRLGILLSFERWALLRETALAALQPVIARGIRVDAFYQEQQGQLGEWFAGGRIGHDTAAVIATLAERWRPGPSWPPTSSWPLVLHALTPLVRAYARAAELPALLIEIAELALSCGGAELAAMLAREALYYLPEKAHALRSKALCELGAALLDQGETATGAAVLDDAIAMAAALTEPAIGASALCQSGLYALLHGDDLGAERRFRGAIDLLSSSDRRPHLRASVHHHLAIALMRQGKDGARHHASIALALRPDPDGPLAEVDRLLLAKLDELRANVLDTNHPAIALPPVPSRPAPEVTAEGSLGSSGPHPLPPSDDPTSRASTGGMSATIDHRATTGAAERAS